jgi:hydrogenase/urease accessory protein HupE
VSRRLVSVVWCALTMLGTVRTAAAHESRPASIEITESRSGSVEVIWKRPLQGDMGLRLVPHLSSGWLDRDPDDLYATADYLIATWHFARTVNGVLRGQTFSVEGLKGTLTDALVRVRFGDGAEQTAVLRGASQPVTLGSASEPLSGRFRFVRLGMAHILGGPDHLLFVLGLILLVSRRRKLLVTVTGFTVGHTMTLIAASLLRLSLPLPVIDLLIAMSILFLAPEILRAHAGGRSLTIDRPYVVAFCFGLLHGLGFASGLSGIGFQGTELVSALLQFNIGVEIAQIAFVIVSLTVIALARLTPVRWPRVALPVPGYAVGIAGAVWVVARAVTVFGS